MLQEDAHMQETRGSIRMGHICVTSTQILNRKAKLVCGMCRAVNENS